MNIKKSLEADYSETVSLEHRKKFAQFFTPYPIAELMAKWLLGNENLQIVLEPAFGLGVFSRVLLSKKCNLQINGFEIDNLIFEKAEKEFSGTANVSLLLEDYMFNDWQNRYDGIICNPPYFKFHDYDNKNVLKEIETKLKCKLNGFTNLYTLFLLKSIHQLKRNGRCAYIIPSEFLNSDYGKLVKTYLLKSGALRHIIVFDFEENVFSDALTTASIILCANDGKADSVQFTNIQSVTQLDTVEKLIDGYPKRFDRSKTCSFSDIDPKSKWKAYYQRQNGHNFKNLVPFSTYAKVVRGIATGANNYFAFNLSKAQKYNIDERYLLPCICHSIDVYGNFFTMSDFEALKQKNKNVFLFNAINSENENVAKYLIKGEQEEINKKFLTANRSPWYLLEKRLPAPIWVSVFNRTGLRFVRNDTNVSNLTTFHCIYPQSDMFSDISINLLFAYLLTDTARQIFEDNSREYGNGLQKFEPNDLNMGKMLDIGKLSTSCKQKIENLYRNNMNNNNKQFVDEINSVFIENFKWNL
jgi:adenine-specific DNA-methyltransferase